MANKQVDPVITAHMDWPEGYDADVPSGVLGFMLGETLFNAVRHGDESDGIGVSIHMNDITQQLIFEVRNPTRGAGNAPGGHGTAWMRRLSDSLEWSGFQCGRDGTDWVVQWRTPIVATASRNLD